MATAVAIYTFIIWQNEGLLLFQHDVDIIINKIFISKEHPFRNQLTLFFIFSFSFIRKVSSSDDGRKEIHFLTARNPGEFHNLSNFF